MDEDVNAQPTELISQPSHTSRNLIIFSLVAVILIVGIVYFIHSSSSVKNQQKDSAIQFLKFGKCISLCPVKEHSEIVGEKNQTYLYYDYNCGIYCDKYRPNESSSLIFSGSDNYKSLSTDLSACIVNVARYKSVVESNTCWNSLFDKYKAVADLSDFKLEDYTEYGLTITNLKCSGTSAEVSVRYDRGDEKAYTLLVSGSDLSGTSNLTDFDVPKVGDSKTYKIDSVFGFAGRVNISSVAVGLKIKTLSGQESIITDFDSKNC